MDRVLLYKRHEDAKTIISQKTDVLLMKALSDDEFLIFQALQQQSSLKVQDIMQF
jgi:primosomal protein N' (replication factor Y)